MVSTYSVSSLAGLVSSFGRVGVVEAEVADAVVFLGDAEVHADGFDVSDMEVSVRLRRETGLNTSVVHSLCEVFFHDLLNKIETTFFCLDFFVFHNYMCEFNYLSLFSFGQL